MRPPACRITLLLAVFLAVHSTGQDTSPSTSTQHAQDPAQIIQFLTHTISWYRQLAVEQQLATQPSDLTYYQENHRVADQVVQLGFDYARAQAQLRAKKPAQQTSQPSNISQYQGLAQAGQKAEQDLQDTQAELQSTRAKLATAPAAKKRSLEAQAAELESEIGLMQARRDAIQSMVEFVSTSNSAGGGVGLRSQVEELAGSVPASLSHPSGTTPTETTNEPSSTTNTAVSKKPEPSGIWGLSADLLSLSEKMSTLKDQISATNELSQNAKNLQKPALEYMRSLVQQGDQLFAAADTATPAQLAQEKNSSTPLPHNSSRPPQSFSRWERLGFCSISISAR
jgi:hypothetical protein